MVAVAKVHLPARRPVYGAKIWPPNQRGFAILDKVYPPNKLNGKVIFVSSLHCKIGIGYQPPIITFISMVTLSSHEMPGVRS